MNRKNAIGLCAIIAALACGANAAQYTIGGITWQYEVQDDGSAALSTTNGESCIESTTSGAITIPSPLDKHDASKLDYGSFTNCELITDVTLPNTVTKVYGAFCNCLALTNVTFAAKTISFNDTAFVNCPNFTSFKLRGDAALSYSVQDGVLYNAAKTDVVRCPTGKTEVSLPSTVSNINKNAFFYSSVRTLALPAKVSVIRANTFSKSYSLESFSVSDENASFTAIDGALYTKDGKTLVCCPTALTDFTIAAEVTNVANYAFSGCIAMKSVSCPNTLSQLGANSFSGMSAIEVVTFNGDVPSLGGSNTLGGLDQSVKIRYPQSHSSSWTARLAELGFNNSEEFSAKRGLCILFQ